MRTLGFGEGRKAEQATPLGIGPSGPERSAVNPSLSARWAEGWDENSFGEPEGRTDKADRPGAETWSGAPTTMIRHIHLRAVSA
jgi:hypothetical protein